MATTTTINPTSDTRMVENSPDNNYGTWTTVKIGYATGTGTMDNSVFRFDVSSFTKPSDIVSAVFTLKVATEWGSTARELTLARCTKEWVDTECTWNEYKDSTAWTTGGGVDDTALTEPTYTTTVGDSSGDIVVDITKLVVDAIQRRAGNLNFIIYMQSTPASTAIATYHSVNAATPSNRPELAVTVADRTAWTGGAGDHDFETAGNWDNGVPSADDYALFISGNDYVNAGVLDCKKAYIGKNFRGRLGEVDTAGVRINASEFHCYSGHAKLYVNINTSATAATVYIGDTNGESGKFFLDGTYDVIVRRTRQRIRLITDDVGSVVANSRALIACEGGEVTSLDIIGGNVTSENGAATVTAVRSARLVLTDDCSNTNLYTSDHSRVLILSAEVDTINIYDSQVLFDGNEGAPIIVSGVNIYGGGLLDTRTDAATYTMGSAIRVYGGRVLLDASKNVSIV